MQSLGPHSDLLHQIQHFHTLPLEIPGYIRVGAGVFSGEGLHPASLASRRGRCVLLRGPRSVLAATAATPFLPSSAWRKESMSESSPGCPAQSGAAVGSGLADCRWVSSCLGPDNKSLETSGNHNLTLAGWTLLPLSWG